MSQDQAARAYEAALGKLNRGALSRARLDARLAAAGFDDAARAAALDRLERAGLLGDAALAEAFLAERRAAGDGDELIRRKLQRRGVGDAAIAAACAAAPGDPRGAATDLARKKLRALRSHPPAVQRRRLAAALARRGFDEDTVAAVLRGLDLGSDDDTA